MALRSFLFAPGNHARRVEKALTLPADAVILDLEDAVAISEKPATRELVVAAFGQPRHGKLYVRVNAYSTEWCYADIVAIARSGLDGIILPKVETADQLRSADWLLANLERERGLPVGGIDLDADHRNRARHEQRRCDRRLRVAHETAGVRGRGLYARSRNGLVA